MVIRDYIKLLGKDGDEKLLENLQKGVFNWRQSSFGSSGMNLKFRYEQIVSIIYLPYHFHFYFSFHSFKSPGNGRNGVKTPASPRRTGYIKERNEEYTKFLQKSHRNSA